MDQGLNYNTKESPETDPCKEGMVIDGMKVVKSYRSECEAPVSWCKDCDLCCDTQNRLHWERVLPDGLTISERKRQGYHVSEKEKRLERRKCNRIIYFGVALMIITLVLDIVYLQLSKNNVVPEMEVRPYTALVMLSGGAVFIYGFIERLYSENYDS